MGEIADGTIARLMRAYDVHDESALAIQMGRDMSTLRVWKTRDAVPLPMLVQASQATGYSLAWLRGEAGAPETDAPRTPDDDATRLALSPREMQLIERYRATDEDGRAAVEMVSGTLATGSKPAGRKRAKVGSYPATVDQVAMSIEVREGPAVWKTAKPVRPDRSGTPPLGGGDDLGGSALLPISSASDSRPLVLTIQGGAGKKKGYEVIPRYRGAASAGRSSAVRVQENADGLDQAGDMAFSLEWMRETFSHTSGQLASVRVQGDSMEPTLHSGETIVIDTAVRRVDVSGIYVIEAHGDRLVKRIDRKLDGRLVILSDNQAYGAEEVRPDDISVLGRMVGRWAR